MQQSLQESLSKSERTKFQIKYSFKSGGVSKSMLTLNEAIIDVKKG
ncbi:hypothetical protein ABTJ36_18020 [Acinetobacter baumannii]